MKIDAERGSRVVLIRHGRTAWNDQGRLMGRADIPLDEVGHAQARELVEIVRAMDPARLVSSPLIRARSTAEPLARATGLPIEEDDRWIEVDVGELEGLTWAAVEQLYPEFGARLRHEPGDTARPGGESDAQLQERSVAALEDCMRSNPGECVVVVSHGGTIRATLAWVLGVPLGEKWRLMVDNASLSSVEMTSRGLVIRFANVPAGFVDDR